MKKSLSILLLSLSLFFFTHTKAGEIPFEKGTFQQALKNYDAQKLERHCHSSCSILLIAINQERALRKLPN